jgi:hypothetical protein
MSKSSCRIMALALATSAILGCSHKSSMPTAPALGVPVLLDINGATKPSGPVGSTVIFEGSGFGAAQGSGRVLFSNGAGGMDTATVASPSDWTDSFIVTTVPAGAATGPAWVRTSGGSSDSLTFTVVSNATFSPSTITWTETTSLPVGLSGHAAAFMPTTGPGTNGVVYVMGGADSTNVPRTDVLYTSVLGTGQVGAWTPTASLPAAVAFHAAVVATPFNSRVQGTGDLYVLGGATNAAGQPTGTIYRGALNADGSVSTWSAAGALPTAVHSLGAVIFHGDLYVAGGASNGNVPVTAVYRARIGTDGTLGAWQALPALPSARAYHAMLSFGEYLYVLGGDGGAVAPNDSTNTATEMSEVAYAKVDIRSGNLATPQWTMSASSLKKAVSKHTAVVGGGDVLVTAGIYNGAKTGSTEETYAQINGDGSVGSFNGATGSNTISSAGGKDLFNHAAVSYVDPTGVAHVMVIGGDDLNNPGKKRAGVWFY